MYLYVSINNAVVSEMQNLQKDVTSINCDNWDYCRVANVTLSSNCQKCLITSILKFSNLSVLKNHSILINLSVRNMPGVVYHQLK